MKKSPIFLNICSRKFMLKIVVLRSIFLFLVFAYIFATPFALAITGDSLVLEGDVVTLNFSGSLYRDTLLVSSNSPYVWQTTYNDAGTYLFTDTNSSHTLTITNNPISFVLNEPSLSSYSKQTIPVSVTTNIPVEYCYTSIQGNTNTLLAITPTTHSGEFTKPDGIYTLEVKCKAGSELVSTQKNILIDTTAPTLSLQSPTQGAIVDGSNVKLLLATNEVSTCTYSSSQDSGQFTSSDYLVHEATVFFNEGNHAYVATCFDVYGNSVNYTFNFASVLKPTARIEIEGFTIDSQDADVLKQGSYPIRLIASEDVTQATLTYTYQNREGGVVSLIKDDNSQTELNNQLGAKEWTGYLIINSVGEDVGSFSTTLTTESGEQGNVITQGKLFLVDTIAPPQVVGVLVRKENDLQNSWLKISWDEIDDATYRIYRSQNGKVTLDDFLATTDEASYNDRTAKLGEPYYYAILAEDKAKNKGPLSEPAGGLINIEESVVQSDDQVYEIQQLSSRIEQTIFDIDAAYKSLETERDEKKLIFIRELGILESLTQKKTQLNSYLKELENLAGSPRYDQRIVEITTDVGNAAAIIPSRITINGNIDYEQPDDTNAISSIFDKFNTLKEPAAKVSYRKTVDDLNIASSFSGSILVGEVLYANKVSRQYTYITQDISFAQQSETMRLAINIPFDIYENQEPRFLPSLDSKEPVPVYDVVQGQTRFSYSILIPKELDLATARTLRNVLLPKEEAPSSQSSITGNAIAFIDWKTINPLYLLGVLTIIVLFVYYVFMDFGPTQQNSPMASSMSVSPAMERFFTTLTQRIEEKPQDFFSRNKHLNQKNMFNEFARSSPNNRTNTLFVKRADSSKKNISSKYFDGEKTSSRGFFPKSSQQLSKNNSYSLLPSASYAQKNTQKSSDSFMPSKSRKPDSNNDFLDVDSATLDSIHQLSLDTSTLILDAHKSIDQKEYIPARDLYEQACARLHETGESNSDVLAKNSKNIDDASELNLLYHKLVLYREMQAATDAANRLDYERLQSKLRIVQATAQKLPDSKTLLISDMKTQYKELLRVANKLAIEKDRVF